MGFDLYMYGVKPGPVKDSLDARDGSDLSYFRVNIWGMQTLRDLMSRMDIAQVERPDDNDPDALISLEQLSYNNGDKVTSAQIRNTLARYDNISYVVRASAFSRCEETFAQPMGSFQMFWGDWIAFLRVTEQSSDGFQVL